MTLLISGPAQNHGELGGWVIIKVRVLYMDGDTLQPKQAPVAIGTPERRSLGLLKGGCGEACGAPNKAGWVLVM